MRIKKIKVKICNNQEYVIRNLPNYDKTVLDINTAKIKQPEKSKKIYDYRLILFGLFLISVIVPLSIAKMQNAAIYSDDNLTSGQYNGQLKQKFPEIYVIESDLNHDTSDKIKNLFSNNEVTADFLYFSENQISFKFSENIKDEISNSVKNIEQDLRKKYIITEDLYRQTAITAIKNQPQNNEMTIYYSIIKNRFIASRKLSDLEKTIDALINN